MIHKIKSLIAQRQLPGIGKLFLSSYLCTALLFTGAVKAYLYINADLELKTIQANEKAKAEIARSFLEFRFDAVLSDLNVLARSPAVNYLTIAHQQFEKRIASDLFKAFALEKKIFDQIAYFDTHGKQVLQVNFLDNQVVEVAHPELQATNPDIDLNSIRALQNKEVYVSPLHLASNQIEVLLPYKPIIYFATPIQAKNAPIDGYVVLSLLGNVLLDPFKELMAGTSNQTLLLNNQGDLLVSPEPQTEWGFMFGHDATFAKTHPQAWKALNQKSHGFWLDNTGLYTFVSVGAINKINEHHVQLTGHQHIFKSSAQNATSDYYWKIVSFIPKQHLPSASLSKNWLTFSIYLGGLLVLLLGCGFFSYTIATRRQLRREIYLKNIYHKQITNNLGEGVVVVDQNGIITESNPEAELLLGWSRKEMIGCEAHSLFHAKPHEVTADNHICAIRAVAFTGIRYENDDEVFYRKDGRALPVGVITSPLTNGDQVEGCVLSFRDMSKIKNYQEEIRQLAYYDTLTNLPNRRLLNNRLELALGLAQRKGRNIAVIFLDLDHFKQVNDTYGHDGGDELLKGIAERLANNTRITDTVSRQGGDEFVIVLSEIKSVEDSIFVARKILKSMRDPIPIHGDLIEVGVSIGMAVYPLHGHTVDELMHAADLAMYQAKNAGRNRYCLSGSSPESL